MKCIPHYIPFYIAKLGFAGVNLILLILIQNIHCGYSLKPPRRGRAEAVLTCTHNVCFERENLLFFPIKFSNFSFEKISVYCMGKFS